MIQACEMLSEEDCNLLPFGWWNWKWRLFSRYFNFSWRSNFHINGNCIRNNLPYLGNENPQ